MCLLCRCIAYYNDNVSENKTNDYMAVVCLMGDYVSVSRLNVKQSQSPRGESLWDRPMFIVTTEVPLLPIEGIKLPSMASLCVQIDKHCFSGEKTVSHNNSAYRLKDTISVEKQCLSFDINTVFRPNPCNRVIYSFGRKTVIKPLSFQVIDIKRKTVTNTVVGRETVCLGHTH